MDENEKEGINSSLVESRTLKILRAFQTGLLDQTGWLLTVAGLIFQSLWLGFVILLSVSQVRNAREENLCNPNTAYMHIRELRMILDDPLVHSVHH